MNVNLEQLKINNPSIEIIEDDDFYNLKNLWLDKTFGFKYSKETDFSELENIELPIELSAIFHKKTQTLEFIYAPLLELIPFLNRKTSFYYKGLEFKTEFKEPSNSLVLLSNGFEELEPDDESNYRNLRQFRDFYRKDQQSSQMKTYYEDKKPFCFFISGDFKKIKNEFIPFCKHINVYLRFFDRKAPIIHIVNIEPKIEDFTIPCKSDEIEYPSKIVTNNIDPVALDLLHIANETGNPRLKYLFHYQVLEYFAYYYLDEELKRKLSNILKNPDILHNYGNYSKIIIEDLKEYTNNNSDKHKLTKLVSDYLTVDDILSELKSNMKFFSTDIEFDGHFKLPALISDAKIFDKIYSEAKESKEKKKEKEKIKQDLINSISDRIERIRNVLVHIRESRENKVIYPTKNNNTKLLPYLYLIRRMSEIVAMKYNV
jgi:hypothetical protein